MRRRKPLGHWKLGFLFWSWNLGTISSPLSVCLSFLYLNVSKVRIYYGLTFILVLQLHHKELTTDWEYIVLVNNYFLEK